MASWDDEYAAFMGSAAVGPSEEESFIDRARAAPDDDDDDIAMGEDPIRLGPVPRNGNRVRIAVLGQDAAEETAFQQLIRHWMNERHAPDVLPGQEMLLGRILDHVRKQVSSVGVVWGMWLERGVVVPHTGHGLVMKRTGTLYTQGAREGLEFRTDADGV